MGVSLHGKDIALSGRLYDDKTRCAHYHGELDIIALKFKCCGVYYPCFQCHAEMAGHAPQRYSLSADADEKVVLCGECKLQLTFDQYRSLTCVVCSSSFNPGCKLHYDLYFDQ